MSLNFKTFKYGEHTASEFLAHVNKLREENGKMDIALSTYRTVADSSNQAVVIGIDRADLTPRNTSGLDDLIEEVNGDESVRSPFLPIATVALYKMDAVFSVVKFLQTTGNHGIPEDDRLRALTLALKDAFSNSTTGQLYYVCENDDPNKEILEEIFYNKGPRTPSTARPGITLQTISTTKAEGLVVINALSGILFPDGAPDASNDARNSRQGSINPEVLPNATDRAFTRARHEETLPGREASGNYSRLTDSAMTIYGDNDDSFSNSNPENIRKIAFSRNGEQDSSQRVFLTSLINADAVVKTQELLENIFNNYEVVLHPEIDNNTILLTYTTASGELRSIKREGNLPDGVMQTENEGAHYLATFFGSPDEHGMMDIMFFFVHPSETREGKMYLVSVDSTDASACSCPAGVRGVLCKHRRRAKELADEYMDTMFFFVHPSEMRRISGEQRQENAAESGYERQAVEDELNGREAFEAVTNPNPPVIEPDSFVSILSETDIKKISFGKNDIRTIRSDGRRMGSSAPDYIRRDGVVAGRTDSEAVATIQTLRAFFRTHFLHPDSCNISTGRSSKVFEFYNSHFLVGSQGETLQGSRQSKLIKLKVFNLPETMMTRRGEECLYGNIHALGMFHYTENQRPGSFPENPSRYFPFISINANRRKAYLTETYSGSNGFTSKCSCPTGLRQRHCEHIRKAEDMALVYVNEMNGDLRQSNDIYESVVFFEDFSGILFGGSDHDFPTFPSFLTNADSARTIYFGIRDINPPSYRGHNFADMTHNFNGVRDYLKRVLLQAEFLEVHADLHLINLKLPSNKIVAINVLSAAGVRISEPDKIHFLGKFNSYPAGLTPDAPVNRTSYLFLSESSKDNGRAYLTEVYNAGNGRITGKCSCTSGRIRGNCRHQRKAQEAVERYERNMRNRNGNTTSRARRTISR